MNSQLLTSESGARVWPLSRGVSVRWFQSVLQGALVWVPNLRACVAGTLRPQAGERGAVAGPCSLGRYLHGSSLAFAASSASGVGAGGGQASSPSILSPWVSALKRIILSEVGTIKPFPRLLKALGAHPPIFAGKNLRVTSMGRVEGHSEGPMNREGGIVTGPAPVIVEKEGGAK